MLRFLRRFVQPRVRQESLSLHQAPEGGFTKAFTIRWYGKYASYHVNNGKLTELLFMNDLPSEFTITDRKYYQWSEALVNGW